MTQEELMDLIDKFDAAGMVNEPVVKALRAVMELHKPTELSWSNETGEYYCDTCDNLVWVPYPCPTIQAIEKELK